jgi:hypothetical protein
MVPFANGLLDVVGLEVAEDLACAVACTRHLA